MGLPTSREGGAIGPHAPVTSTSIAAIEDSIIGHKHDSLEPTFTVPSYFTGLYVPGNAITAVPGHWQATAVADACVYDVGAVAGTRYTKVTFDFFVTGSSPQVVCAVLRQSRAAGGISSQLDTSTPLTGAWSTRVFMLPSPILALSGDAIFIQFGLGGVGAGGAQTLQIKNVSMSRDRL